MAVRFRRDPPLQVDVVPNDDDRLLKRIEDLSRGARANWFALMAYLAFVGVTLLGVEDVDFFVDTRQTKLPLVDVSIPTPSFFWTAPLLGIALYAYLHFHLMSLWHVLADAPKEVDGKPLGERAFPWLVNDLALSTRRDKPVWTQPLRWLSNAVTIVLVWVAGPLVLAGFWWRSMPAHELWMTLLLSLCLWLSLLVGATSWWTFRQTVRLRLDPPHPWRGWGRWVLAGVITVWVFGYGAARSQYADRIEAFVNAAIDWGETYTGPLFINWSFDDPTFVPGAPLSQAGFYLNVVGLSLVSANLAEVELVPKPADWRPLDITRRRFRAEWCRRQGIPPGVCGDDDLGHIGDHTTLTAQRTAWCRRTDYICTVLEGKEPDNGATVDAPSSQGQPTCPRFFADMDRHFRSEWTREWFARLDALPPLILTGRDLRNADATAAFLPKADLRAVHLEGADLSHAHLESANLSYAHLEEANLKRAYLENAHLRSANLDGAYLSHAHLESVNLGMAYLRGAFFRGAHLKGVDLSHAHLDSAILYGANLDGADLRWATLDHDTNLSYALLHNANVHGARGLTQQQLDTTLGNDDTHLPYDAATGLPLHVWSCWSEDTANMNVILLSLTVEENLRARYVCPPGTEPECRGTLVLDDGTWKGKVGPRGSACPDRVPWPGVTTPALEDDGLVAAP